MCKDHQERDELRARFTTWMKVLALRTRRRYLNGKNETIFVPLEEVSPELVEKEKNEWTKPDSFDFEEQQLAKAFADLPDRKRQVLTMLFALEMDPQEIAKRLGCTVQNVYNQKSLALVHLRTTLKGGEESD